jgi:ethanolamine ammonia-lyase small subunit
MTPDPWTGLRAHTAARIALGRSGASLPTAEWLRFGLAHAQARDAVHQALDDQALAHELRRHGFDCLVVESAAADRAGFLQRPDLGRRLSERSAALLRSLGSAQGLRQAQPERMGTLRETQPPIQPEPPPPVQPEPPPPIRPELVEGPVHPEPVEGPELVEGPIDLLFIVGDGLSATASQRHALPLLCETRPLLEQAGLAIGPVVLAHQCRVALGDEIGSLLHARLAAVLLGERPGLSSPDSLGAYITHAPRPGRRDAERNCISNIRPEGLAAAQAARKLAWLCSAALQRGATGIELKDESDAPPRLAAPGA